MKHKACAIICTVCLFLHSFIPYSSAWTLLDDRDKINSRDGVSGRDWISADQIANKEVPYTSVGTNTTALTSTLPANNTKETVAGLLSAGNSAEQIVGLLKNDGKSAGEITIACLGNNIPLTDVKSALLKNGFSTQAVESALPKTNTGSVMELNVSSILSDAAIEMPPGQGGAIETLQSVMVNASPKTEDEKIKESEVSSSAPAVTQKPQAQATAQTNSPYLSEVQSMRSSGKSASQVVAQLLPVVSESKPVAKFRYKGFKISKLRDRATGRPIYKFKVNAPTQAGEGEVNLAKAMLQAGYSAEEVSQAFADVVVFGPGSSKLRKGYDNGTISTIISKAQSQIQQETASEQAQTVSSVKAQESVSSGPGENNSAGIVNTAVKQEQISAVDVPAYSAQTNDAAERIPVQSGLESKISALKNSGYSDQQIRESLLGKTNVQLLDRQALNAEKGGTQTKPTAQFSGARTADAKTRAADAVLKAVLNGGDLNSAVQSVIASGTKTADVAGGLKQLGLSTGETVSSLKAAGIKADEVFKAFGITPRTDNVFSALIRIMSGDTQETNNPSVTEITAAMLSAGHAAAEVVGALKEITIGDKASNKNMVSAAIKSIISVMTNAGAGFADTITALKENGCTDDQIKTAILVKPTSKVKQNTKVPMNNTEENNQINSTTMDEILKRNTQALPI